MATWPITPKLDKISLCLQNVPARPPTLLELIVPAGLSTSPPPWPPHSAHRPITVLLLTAFPLVLVSLVIQTLPLLIQLVQVGVFFHSSSVSPHALVVFLSLQQRPGSTTTTTSTSPSLIDPAPPPRAAGCTKKKKKCVSSVISWTVSLQRWIVSFLNWDNKVIFLILSYSYTTFTITMHD